MSQRPTPQATDPRTEGFTETELDLIVTMTREWMAGCEHPTRATSRHLTDRVKAWAVRNGLIARWPLWPLGAPRPAHQRWVYPNMDQQAELHRVGDWHGYYSPARDLPPAALWRMVKPMLMREDGSVRGFTVTREPGWHDLNIWPQGKRLASDASLAEQRDVMIRLDQHHYLIAQMAGSTWVFTLTDHDF